MEQRLAPAKTADYEKRKKIATLANERKLERYHDLNLIENYAAKFGLDPDEVYCKTSFDTIILFNEKWKDYAEYYDRYNDIEKLMTESTPK